jgi:hypothetical protein
MVISSILKSDGAMVIPSKRGVGAGRQRAHEAQGLREGASFCAEGAAFGRVMILFERPMR